MKKCLIFTDSLSKNAGGVGTVLNTLWRNKEYRFNKFLYDASAKIVYDNNNQTVIVNSHSVLLKYKPEVIHVHGMWNKHLLLLIYYKILNKDVKLILTPHGMLSAWALSRGRFKKLIYIFLIKYCIRKLSFQALNDDEVNEIRIHFPYSEIHIIGNPVAAKKLNNVNKNAYDFLSIGRICEQKNSLEFCKLYNKIEKYFKDLPEIKFYGWSEDPKYFSEFKRQVSMSSKINYMGSLVPEDVQEVLSKSKFFIIYSNFEGFPMSCIEALVNGCIVIGNSTSGLSGLRNNKNVKILDGNLEDFIMSLRDIKKSNLVFNHNDKSLDEFKIEHIVTKLNKMYGSA